MPTLVYTTTVGSNPNIIELSTPQAPQQVVARELNTSDVLNDNPSVGLLEWNLGAPLVLTTIPAGHQPGLYQMTTALYMRVGAATGTVAARFDWGEPGVGAALPRIFAGINVVPVGIAFTLAWCIQSSGQFPLAITYTPAAITGAPRGNVIASATYLSGPVT